jgi:hypothetical protein
MTWITPNNWTVPFKRRVSIYGYTNQIIMGKHPDGRLFFSNGINLQVGDRNGENLEQLWTAKTQYPGLTVSQILILPTGTMLIRMTKWDGEGYILRSNDQSYTAFTNVFSDWNGEMLFRSWASDNNGVVLAGEYTTALDNMTVTLWKATNDGRDWEEVRVFRGRGDVDTEVFHIHCVQYDDHSGLWWFSCGDTNSESRVYSTDGNTLNLIGTGSQHWRAVSFTFDENFVYWGTDGTVDSKAIQMRYDKRTGEKLYGEKVPGYIFVTQKIQDPSLKSPLFLSDGHSRWISNTLQLSNNGMNWYDVFTWKANPDAVPFPAFNGFVDNGDGRVFAYTTSIYRHDTGEEFNNGTVIIDIV